MDQQRTLAKPAACAGVGLHTGERVKLSLKPAEPGRGVVFVRSDVEDRDNEIPAHALNVSTTQLGTNLTNRAGVSVATVEHFLAACSGMGLDNVVAELDGPETPIMDGSSEPFVALIRTAGLAEQGAPRRKLRLLKAVEVRDGAKFARLSPGDGFTFRVAIDFSSQAIRRQTIEFAMKPGAFAEDVGYARTFGFAHEIDQLRAMGKARGGSLENAIVVDGETILNPEGLQIPDEFVRHKLLDVIGDLFLAGGPIEGLYEGEQPGHALNNRLLRALYERPDAYLWESARAADARVG